MFPGENTHHDEPAEPASILGQPANPASETPTPEDLGIGHFADGHDSSRHSVDVDARLNPSPEASEAQVLEAAVRQMDKLMDEYRDDPSIVAALRAGREYLEAQLGVAQETVVPDQASADQPPQTQQDWEHQQQHT